MHLTVTTASGDFSSLEVPDDITVENFSALCKVELPSLAAADRLLIVHNARPLAQATNQQTLKELGIGDNDMLLMAAAPNQQQQQRAPQPQTSRAANNLPAIDWSQVSIPGQTNGGAAAGQSFQDQQKAMVDQTVNELLHAYHNDADTKSRLKQSHPQLAEALEKRDQSSVRRLVEESAARQRAEREQRMRAMADPFSAEAQKLIEDEIRAQNIHHQYENAMEHMPEAFAQVIMLYVDLKVNGHAVKAFVDSGAQTTIMSMACAKRTGVDRLVDIRFSGIAKGVGTQKILGKIHMAQLEIAGHFLPTSLTVLEDQSMDLLLGLDMLKRHQCVIDLQKNQLYMGTTDSSTPFLGEHEVPEHARLNGNGMELDEDRQLAEALQNSSAETTKGGSTTTTTTTTATPTPAPAFSADSPATTAIPADLAAKVGQLEGMGFGRDDALKALRAQAGDVQKAAVALLASAIKPPTN